MKKVFIVLLSIFLFSCEKEFDSFHDIENIETTTDIFLEIYSELESDGTIYIFEYPEESLTSYFQIDYNTTPLQRVYWESPDVFATVMWQDTIWTEVINFSTYANDEGAGHQMVCVHPTLIGDTLNLIGIINDLYGNEVMRKEILVKIQ